MPKRRTLLVSLALLVSAACVTHREQVYVGSADYELASRTAPDGATERYELRMGSGPAASLQVRTEYDKRRRFLGFQVLELDKATAEARGLEPYSGLLVEGLYGDSSAQRAGVVPGDILYSLGGRKTIYRVHIAEVEAGLTEGQDIVARLGRGGRELELTLTARAYNDRVTDTESVALETVTPQKPYAGVVLRGIPAVWCEKIYGEPRNAIVVAQVEVGSPAWLAGLRGGDIIDKVDGRPVPPVAELSRLIAERGSAGQSLRVEVSRAGSQPYEATVDLHDYGGETRVVVPLIFHVNNGVHRDSWGIGPWGLIMNNRNSYVADSTTRRVETRNVFHALLGLIKVDSRPDETRVRLLWIITFDT